MAKQTFEQVSRSWTTRRDEKTRRMQLGSTLQMDADANSSTVTIGRLAGFGGAPNMGHDPHGRRHSTQAWLDLITENKPIVRGRKLVVQTVETFQSGGVPAFVDTLDAVFATIARTPHNLLWSQSKVAVVLAIVYAALFSLTYFAAQKLSKDSAADSAVLALTLGFPNAAAVGLPSSMQPMVLRPSTPSLSPSPSAP